MTVTDPLLQALGRKQAPSGRDLPSERVGLAMMQIISSSGHCRCGMQSLGGTGEKITARPATHAADVRPTVTTTMSVLLASSASKRLRNHHLAAAITETATEPAGPKSMTLVSSLLLWRDAARMDAAESWYSMTSETAAKWVQCATIVGMTLMRR